MKLWLYIKEESIYYFQLLRNWLVGDREAELENFESTRFHLYVELFYFCFIFSDYVINVLCHLMAPWNCYVIIKPILCLEADDDWLRSSDWLNLVFRSIYIRGRTKKFLNVRIKSGCCRSASFLYHLRRNISPQKIV